MKMWKKSIVASFVISAFSLGSGAINAAETLKMAHNLDRNHAYHKAAEFFAKRVDALTKGDIKVRVYPNAELGKQREVLELVQNGSVAMTQINVAPLEGFAKEYSVFSLPYLFKDKDHLYRAMQSPAANKILQGTKDKGFIGLAFHESGARSFYGKKAYVTPADLKGLKMRTQQSPMAIRMMELFGAVATPLDYGELYTALQQGVVDGAENNPTALTSGRHGEVSKFFSIDEHTMTPDALVISTKVWDKLSPANQKAIQQAATESMLEMRKLWKAFEDAELEKAKAMGVTFVTVNKDAYRAAVKPMYDEMQAKEPAIAKIVEEMSKL